MADALLAKALLPISTDNEQGMISVNYLPNKPDTFELFHSLSEKGIIIDAISQTADTGRSIYPLPACGKPGNSKLVKILKPISIQTQVYEAITQVAGRFGHGTAIGIAARIFRHWPVKIFY